MHRETQFQAGAFEARFSPARDGPGSHQVLGLSHPSWPPGLKAVYLCTQAQEETAVSPG